MDGISWRTELLVMFSALILGVMSEPRPELILSGTDHSYNGDNITFATANVVVSPLGFISIVEQDGDSSNTVNLHYMTSHGANWDADRWPLDMRFVHIAGTAPDLPGGNTEVAAFNTWYALD